MASTNVAIRVTGQDRTGGLFSRLAAQARSVGLTAGAFKAVGAAVAGIGFSVVKAASVLGEMSDMAQRAGTSTDEITKLSSALGAVGVKGSSVEDVTKMFERMARETGRSGMDGFMRTAEEIAKLPTLAQRAEAAVRSFGKSGQQLMPVIEGIRANGRGAIEGVAAAMPQVTQAAADAGDAMADGFADVWSSVKAGALNAVGDVFGTMEAAGGDARVAFAMFGAEIQKDFEIVGAVVSQIVSNPFEAIGQLVQIAAVRLEQFAANVVGWAASIVEVVARAIKAAWDSVVNGKTFSLSDLAPTITGELVDAVDDAADKAAGDLWGELVPTDKLDAIMDRYNKKMEAAALLGTNNQKAALAVQGMGETAGRGATAKPYSDPKLVLGGSYEAVMSGLRQRNRSTPTEKAVVSIEKTVKELKESAEAALKGNEEILLL